MKPVAIGIRHPLAPDGFCGIVMDDDGQLVMCIQPQGHREHSTPSGETAFRDILRQLPSVCDRAHHLSVIQVSEVAWPIIARLADENAKLRKLLSAHGVEWCL